MRKPATPRLPVAPPAEADDAPAANKQPCMGQPESDHYRQQLVDDERLTIMHTRIYDHWRPSVGAPIAYKLARVAYNDNAAYQRLKREAMAS